MDTNQRIRELADMFQLAKTKSGTWTFDLPPICTGGPLPYMPSDQGVYETDSEGRVTYRETIEHLWFCPPTSVVQSPHCANGTRFTQLTAITSCIATITRCASAPRRA